VSALVLIVAFSARAEPLDVGVVAIVAPADTVDSGLALLPAAMVANSGSVGTSFSVVMRIGSQYAVMVSDTLDPGETDTAVFSYWTPPVLGPVQAVCYTVLAGDSNPANDTARKTVIVRPQRGLDVGVVRVIAPQGVIDSGTIFTPKAEVRNFGRGQAEFPVTLRLGATYAHAVQDTLDPGRTDTVFFPDWQANQTGTLPVVCFTGLADDENRANDTLRDSIRVRAWLVHDLAAVQIVAPAGQLRAGDTVVPEAVVHNYGRTTERVFDVRFRIGSSYFRSAVYIYDLLPESSATITFPHWVATAGTHPVSCSTALAVDVNPDNDKVTSHVVVVGPESLALAPDYDTALAVAESLNLRCYARLASGAGDIIGLIAPAQDNLWTFTLLDSAGRHKLTDTNNDSLPDLGLCPPGLRRYFTLRVKAPPNLHGDPDALLRRRFVVHGFGVGDSSGRDSLVIKLRLVGGPSVHNSPNPLQQSTTFFVGLPYASRAGLDVYDRNGTLVRRVFGPDSAMEAGVNRVNWAGNNTRGTRLAPGTYHYVLTCRYAGRTEAIRKKLVVSVE